MPIYEYRCPECAHEFETIQKLSDPRPPCPKCGHGEVAKKVSRTSFQLKGSGWYVTDYSNGGPGAAKPATDTSSAESGSSSSGSDSSSSSDSGGSAGESSSSDSGSTSSGASSSSGDSSDAA